ncbi:MAG: 23S rRNA (uracil(1939)-C(5))-methyltransferase RlmD [Candidatus Sulfotelmatobacter sp.]
MLLTIEKLIYGGDGLARLPDSLPHRSPNLPPDNDGRRGKAVFVPFVLSGEKIEASLTEEKPGFARARAQAIVEASPHRVRAGCPYFGHCGGCHYQHAEYEHQLAIKEEILRENLRRIAKLELACEIKVHPSPPWNYRNRARLQVQARPEFAAGYFEMASHRLLAVEECPISSPLINRGITALWLTGRTGKVPEGVREVEFFADAGDAQLLVELACANEARRAVVRAWAEELRAALPEIVGVVAFRGTKPGSQDLLIAVGAAELTYRTQQAAFRVSAGAFFQTNRHLIDELVQTVVAGSSGDLALDLYAGVGLFSTALACNVRHIVSVESSQTAVADLEYNLPSNGKAIQAATEPFLSQLDAKGREGKGAVLPSVFRAPDLAVVDPPRAGLGERVARLLAALAAPSVVYVSCDPATLARDLVPLLAEGYRVERADIVDLFPQTYHVESVLHLAR